MWVDRMVKSAAWSLNKEETMLRELQKIESKTRGVQRGSNQAIKGLT